MKPSNFIFPAIIAVAFLANSLSAQTPTSSAAAPATPSAVVPATGREFHRGGPLQRLRMRREVAEKLGLTAEQKSQLKSAHQTAVGQVRAIRADSTLTPEDKKARIHAVVENVRAQMKQVLTPDQQQRFEQLRAEHRAKVEGSRAQPATAPAPTSNP